MSSSPFCRRSAQRGRTPSLTSGPTNPREGPRCQPPSRSRRYQRNLIPAEPMTNMSWVFVVALWQSASSERREGRCRRRRPRRNARGLTPTGPSGALHISYSGNGCARQGSHCSVGINPEAGVDSRRHRESARVRQIGTLVREVPESVAVSRKTGRKLVRAGRGNRSA